VTPRRVERHLRMTGAWDAASTEAVYLDAVASVARQDGVVVTDDELQEAVDALREDLGLASASDTVAWLAAAGLELDDMEREAELRVLEARLCDGVAHRDVEAEFQNQRVRFDSVRLRVFLMNDQPSAAALARRLQDADEAEALDAALERCAGQRMTWGWFLRDELPEEAASHIFRALPGDVVGPLQVEEGWHAVYDVEALRPAVLDADADLELRLELVAARIRLVLNPDDPRRFVLT